MNKRTSMRVASKLARRPSSDGQVKLAEGVTVGMSDLMASKSDELVRLLKLTEDTSRRVVATEMDLRRSRELQARLEADIANLHNRLKEGEKTAAVLARQKDELSDKSGKLSKSIDEMRKDVSHLSGDVENLGQEAKGLHAEVEGMEKRKTKLAEDISRLKKVRQEYLVTISKMRAEKDDLTA